MILSTGATQRPYIAVTNYTREDATIGRRISFAGKKVGIYDWGTLPVELWAVSGDVPQPPIAVEKTNEAKNVVAAIPAATLPADVTQADAKLLALRRQYNSLSGQILNLSQKQSEKAALRLPGDAGVGVQIKNLQYQAQQLSQQILKAMQWDYQVRESHKLPRFDELAATRNR